MSNTGSKTARTYETEEDHHHLLAVHGEYKPGAKGPKALTVDVAFCRDTKLSWEDHEQTLIGRFVEEMPNVTDTCWGGTLAALRSQFRQDPHFRNAQSRSKSTLVPKAEVSMISTRWTDLVAKRVQDILIELSRRDYTYREGSGCAIRTASMDRYRFNRCFSRGEGTQDGSLKSREITGLTKPFSSVYRDNANRDHMWAEKHVARYVNRLRDESISRNRAKITHPSSRPALFVSITVNGPQASGEGSNIPANDETQVPMIKVNYSFCANSIYSHQSHNSKAATTLGTLDKDDKWRLSESKLIKDHSEKLQTRLDGGEELTEAMIKDVSQATFQAIQKDLTSLLNERYPARGPDTDPLIRSVDTDVYDCSLRQDSEPIKLRVYKKGKKGVSKRGELGSDS